MYIQRQVFIYAIFAIVPKLKSVWSQTNAQSWIFIVLAHWNNSPRIDMSPHLDTLFWFRANQSLLFLLNAAYLAEKQQIQIL
jgi:hypothetical protein